MPENTQQRNSDAVQIRLNYFHSKGIKMSSNIKKCTFNQIPVLLMSHEFNEKGKKQKFPHK